MKRVIGSIVISIFLSVITGVGLEYCLQDTPFHHHDTFPLLKPILYSAHFFGVLINLVFFYIRRWDGCIEKLGGLTFTFLLYLASISPLLFFRNLLTSDQQTLLMHFILNLFVQFSVIGFVATHFLRTKNFNPPKPGNPLRW